MKKKLICAVTALTMAVSLMACGGSANGTAATTAKAAGATTAAGAATTAAAKAATTAAATTAAKAATTAAAGATTAAASGNAGTATKGVLVMATNAEFPPYEYHDNNEIVGIDVEIAKAVAEQMGCELKIDDIAFDSIIPEVTSGKADIGAAGMTVTEDRKQSVDFSDTYAHASQVIIVKSDSAIADADALKGKKVGVQQGTTGDIYISDDLGDGSVERYNKGMEAVQALSQGKVDAVVIDSEPAKVFVKQVQGLKILDKSYTDEDYAIAVKKGNTALVQNINAALKKLKDEGKLDAIVAKYIKAQ